MVLKPRFGGFRPAINRRAKNSAPSRGLQSRVYPASFVARAFMPGLAALLLIPALAAVIPSVAAAEAPRSEITLVLKDYLALVERGDAAEKERQRRESSREAPVAEVVSQRVRVALGEGDVAEVTADYEVLVQGEPKGPVVLPVTGVPRKAEVKTPGAALSAGAKAGEWLLVAPAPGRYAVEISGPVPLSVGGVSRLVLAPAAAPVALTEVELPADLAWSAPGTVVVEDRVEGARRTVRLTSRRGQAQTLEVRRKVDGDAGKLLAQSLVLTLLQLRPDGPRRHDVVIYEVSRGGLGSFTVDLPAGLAVETVGTDEGEVVPAIESRRLTVQRRQQLHGVGYLVLTSTPVPGAELPLDPVTPEGTVRARYVALASSIAADAHPLPAASWSRIDLDDLPPTLLDAIGGVDLAAAWRLASEPAGTGGGPRMAVSTLPAAPSLPAVASLRETTTLITLDGTLLHRDRIILRPAAIGTALDLTLAAGATLWSARVDGVAVRPLERGNGKISVPLGFDTGRDAVVEVVSVQEKAIPAGRSELALDVPRVAVPVQEHRWRLLLPDGALYRFRSGDLRPAANLEKIPTARDPWTILQGTPGVLTDRIDVGGNESGQQSQYVGPGSAAGTTARLRGRAADERGRVLPGVTVTLQPPGGLPPIVQVTDAQGVFNFLDVPPGDCTLNAELAGFSSLEYPSIRLTAGRISSIEIRLTVHSDLDAFAELKQGLVGGVKPLPITIPESGKLLLLSGVLPPEKIGVEIEVKGNKEKRGWF